MNGIEKITRRLNENAQAEISEILDAAAAAVRNVNEHYASLAAGETAELRARNEKAAAECRERLVSAAQAEARKTILAAKQELVECAYARALEKLCTLSGEAYTEMLAALMRQAMPGGGGEVIFSPKDQKAGKAAVRLANQKSGGTLTVSGETRPMKGGLILRNGRVEINCTFETLIRLERQASAGIVAERLFG